MKSKYIIVIGTILLIVTFVLKNSYALNEEELNNLNTLNQNNLDITLEYTENEIELNNNIYNHINLIDNSLIPTATFNMSDSLNNNYDFLTIFAINFILNNEQYYKDEIIIGQEYTYNDGYNNYTTNKYINLDTIYDITYNILGKNNYYIINDYLKIENNLVPLLLLKEYNFFMELEKIEDIVKFSNNYEVSVKYKDIDLIYKYIFENIDNKLILSNIEIN